MAFFPHVNSGDEFQPNSVLENNIRDCVNAFNAYGAKALQGASGNSTRIPVWNASGKILPAGSAVAVSMDESSPNGILPCDFYTADNRPWGILPQELAPGAIGDCIVGGIAVIPKSVSGKPGDMILPVPKENDATTDFAVIPNGGARILYAGSQSTTIQFVTHDSYFGLFKLVLMKTSGSAPDTEEDESSSSSSSNCSSSSSSSSSSGSSTSSSSSEPDSGSDEDDSSSSSESSSPSDPWEPSSSSEDEDSSSSSGTGLHGNGILGLVNGHLVLYPTGSCDDEGGGTDDSSVSSPDDSSTSSGSNSGSASESGSGSNSGSGSGSDSSSSGSSSSFSFSGSDDSSGDGSGSEDSSNSEDDSSGDSGSSEEDSSSQDSSSQTPEDDSERIMLAVVDGTNPNASVCGFIDMGTKRISVPRSCFSNWKQQKTLYVYLQTGGNGVSVKMESNYPGPSSKKFRRLLGRLIYRNGAYSVVQEQYGPVIENYQMVLGSLG